MVAKLQISLPEVTLTADYNDPVTFEPMTSAVLIPCGHSVNEITAKGLMDRKMGCPLDRIPFTVYYPNINLRNIVISALSTQPQSSVKQSQEVMKEGPSPIAIAHYERGKELFHKNEYEKAINAFLAAIILYPIFEKAQLFLEAALEAQKKTSSPSSSLAPAISSSAISSSSTLLPFLPSSAISKPPEKEAPFPDYLTQALNPIGRGKALIKAVETEILRDIRYLLSQDTPVNGKDAQGRTPLLVACQKNNHPILELLIQNGAPVDGEDAQAALASAIENGSREIVKVLVKEGIPLKNVKSLPGRTPLFLAYQKNDIEILLLLIRNGAPVDGEDAQAALASATEKDSREMVRTLVKEGVFLMGKETHRSYPGYEHRTTSCVPLQTVIKKGYMELLRFFLSTQNQPNGLKLSAPFFYHSDKSSDGYSEITDITCGDNALLTACESENLDVVRLLLEYGVDLDKFIHKKDHGYCELQNEQYITKRNCHGTRLRFDALQKKCKNIKLRELLENYTSDGTRPKPTATVDPV